MLTLELVVAIQSYLGIGILVALALATALLVPYLVKEIRKGKVELGPRLPTGPSEPNPGRRGNPAPGHPEAQADPYDVRAQR
ncbi:MAG TPA: hypothetical protein VGJ39_00505 [Vicinamibacterales bacterium]